MGGNLAVRPLASWDAFTVRLDRSLLSLFALRLLRRHSTLVEAIDLEGDDQKLRVTTVVRWAGTRWRASVEVEEIYFKGGFLGIALHAIKGPGGLGLPRFLWNGLFQRLPVPVDFDKRDNVAIVDLRSYLPPGLELEVRSLSIRGEVLEVALGPGYLAPPAPPVEDLSTADVEPVGV